VAKRIRKRGDGLARRRQGLAKIHPWAAGIDIGAGEHYVAVPPGTDRDGQDVRSFGSFTCDLMQVADWLQACGVTTVAMESTGVYWIPLYDLLESRGLEVHLVDPRELKRVPGRKTDVLDCQWLQELHTFGLLSGAFRPPEQIAALRAYVRQREMLISYASDHVQHMQKAMTQMNVKLDRVVSDITGVTGLRIIRAIVAGERDPRTLASLRVEGCHNDEATIAKALEGTWRAEHVFSLKQAVELYDTYQEKVRLCDAAIEAHLAHLDDHSGGGAITPSRRKRRKNQPHFDLRTALFRATGVDLTRIEGLEATTVLKVVSEIGTDMSRWPSVKHFASWLGLCPGSKKSGGRNRSSRTKPSANRAATALRLAAQSLHHSRSWLGAFLRRKAMQKDMPKAITATAHKLARLIYFMLRYGAEYVAKTQEHYEELHRHRTFAALTRTAKRLGYILVPQNPTEPLPSPA
jgi:transposase